MAAGDTIIFTQFKEDLGAKIHNLGSDNWKLALVNSGVSPSPSTIKPHWGGTGTTNYSVNESATGGNYSGPIALDNVSFTVSMGIVSWYADKILIPQDASNPTDVRWLMCFNDSDVNKRIAFYVDLGAVRDLTDGPFEIRWNGVDGNGAMMEIPQ